MLFQLQTTDREKSMAIKVKANDPEVFAVQSIECGLCAIYDNISAACDHRDEMNKEAPNDHYWIESFRIRS